MRTALAFLIVTALPSPALAVTVPSWTTDARVASTAVAILGAAWLAFAVWAIIRSSRTRIQVGIAQAWGMRLRGVLTTVPEAYLIVDADGAATASDMLRSWLRLDGRVQGIDDLAPSGTGGLMADDFAELRADIMRMSLSGEGFARVVRALDSDRALVVQGRLAPPEVAGDRGVIVWFRDATDVQTLLQRLEADKAELTEALQASAALLEAAPFPVWRRDPGLQLRHVNTAYAQAVQAASGAAAVAAQAELVDSAGGSPSRAAAASARDSGTVQRREEPVIIGAERRVLVLVDVPLGPAGIGGFAIDVTDREEARLERDRLERSQTDTLNRLSAGVALFAADRSLTFFNRAFCDLFKLDAAFLSDRPEFDRVLERMQEVRRLPESRDFPSWRRERRAWFTDAIAAVEEIWALPDTSVLRVIAQPHPDGGVLLIFEDRTEQLRLASSRDTLVKVQEATLDNLHEGVAVFAADGRVQLWNTRFAEMLGFDIPWLETRPSVEDLLYRAEPMLTDFEQARLVLDVLGEMTAGERRQPRAARFELADGRVLDFGAVPLPDGNALFTFVDTTDTQRIEMALRDRNDALEAADRLKSAFVANISYELRTPLTAISGFTEMLAAGYAGALTDKQAEYVGSILSSSGRLELLINDILDLATNEVGKLVLDIIDVPVAPLVGTVVAMTADAARGRNLRVETDIVGDAGSIEADERRLKQILYNLLANAIRFTPPGGRIGIAVGGTADGVTIVITDTGIGIPEAEQNLVFDRFRKASNATGQGVGLGLAMVRQFVGMHGGTVTLSSVLGEGTTVSIMLPRYRQAGTIAW